MTEKRGAGAPDTARWDEALAWHLRIEDAHETEMPYDRIQAFRTWVADERNRRTYDQLCDLMSDPGRYRKQTYPTSARLAADDHDPSLPLPLSQASPVWPGEQQFSAPQPSHSRWRKLTALAATVLVASCGALLYLERTGFRWWAAGNRMPSVQRYQTASGKVSSVQLADGSTVVLGGQSSFTVKFTTAQRAVTLEQGEAWFNVSRDRLRPFTVAAGPRTITAVGTAFDVRRDSDQVVVTVTEGSVDVAIPSVNLVDPTLPSAQERVSAHVSRG